MAFGKDDIDEADRLVSRAIQLDPKQPPFHAMSYYKMRMYKAAIPHLNLFAKAYPRHPEIHGILGICYEGINDLYSAYEEYMMQVRVNPTNEIGRYAASRINVLRPILEGSRKRR